MLYIMLERLVQGFTAIELEMALRGIARLNPHCPQQAEPIIPDMLLAIYHILDLSLVDNVVFWLLFTLPFFSFQRKSNLVVSRVNKSPVRSCDIKIGTCGLLITLHWTKMIQFGHKNLVIPVVHIPGSVLCAVRAYVNMCQLVQAPMEGPVFVKPFSGELVPITYI